MKLELKNIKVHEGLSEETYAYTARVYVDGKPAIDVSNDGHGGCDYQYPVHNHTKAGDQIVSRVNAWCKNSLPKWELGGDEYETDLEMWCSEQVTNHLLLKDMRRALKSKVLFVDDKDDLREIRWKGLRKITDRHIEMVAAKYASAAILNSMPEAQALEAYRKFAA